MSARSIAKRIKQSRGSGGGNWLKQGKGTLVVKLLKYDPDAHEGETFIAELFVKESQSIPGAVFGKGHPSEGKPEEANAPGTTVSYVQQFEVHKETAFPNTQTFLFMLLDESQESIDAAAKKRIADKQVPESWCREEGKKPEEWTGDDEFAVIFDRLVSKEQPARGMQIRYETYTKWTKAKDKLLTLPKWETVKGQTSEQIKQERAALDGLPVETQTAA